MREVEFLDHPKLSGLMGSLHPLFTGYLCETA